MEVTVKQDSINVEASPSINITVDAIGEISPAESTTVELIPDNYVLSSVGIYTGKLDGDIPVWLTNAIQQELTTGDGNLTTVVNDLATLVGTLQSGVNQNITDIATVDENLNALETSVVSSIGDNTAAIVNLDITKVTGAEATAAAVTVVSSTFNGDVDAYVGAIASTYVDANSAIAADIDVVVASVNGVTASVSEISIASVDEGEARAKHSLVVDADGSIAGYVAETDGTTSEFVISADIFKVGTAGTNYTPLVVNTTEGRVEFNGFVEFTGLGIDSGSTTIDGGTIDTVDLSAISADLGTITAGVMYSTLNSAGNGPSSPNDYAMKIDLDNGEIHIV